MIHGTESRRWCTQTVKKIKYYYNLGGQLKRILGQKNYIRTYIDIQYDAYEQRSLDSVISRSLVSEKGYPKGEALAPLPTSELVRASTKKDWRSLHNEISQILYSSIIQTILVQLPT